MSKRVGMEVSIAVAEAVKLANVDVVAAYPITPQTHIVEHLSELVADGHLDAQFIPVESEHSAMSACIGSSAAGARTFTSSASQGLALMHEVLFVPPGMRLPIVLAVANRALSAPINIWNDHSDIMPERDTGWIQLFAENGQEALDMTIQAFRIAEDPSVLLPVAVNIDGFSLSHVIEPVMMPDQEEVNRYLPPYQPKLWLNPAKPHSIGMFGMPEVYTETKMETDQVLVNSITTIKKAWKEYEAIFGRGYETVASYKAEDADTILITMGSVGETAMTAVDEMRAEGKKVGLVRLRLWRPFPDDDFKAAVKHAKKIGVVDRSVTLGSNANPMAQEIRSLLYHDPARIPVFSFSLGIGGRDVTREDFKYIYDRCQALPSDGQPRFEMVGVKE